jgi:branched-chain amino acid transport system ATP-binding protein
MPVELALQNVAGGYGNIEVLHDVSMWVPRGATVALLGRNGAGKTTTLGAITGQVAVRSGVISLGGQAITRLSAFQRAERGITVIPEGRGVFPGLSVADNLALGADAARGVTPAWKRGQLTRVLELFPRLGERMNQRAGTLSGGEQQMLAMSRAFLAKPRVLLMDEVSMGLAPQVVALLYSAVRELKDEGTTMMLVEQYPTYALRLADICYVLRKGSIAFAGDPGELRAELATASRMSLPTSPVTRSGTHST